MKKFYIHRLGCPKNDVDAEYIAGFLLQHNLTEIDDPEKADLLIVNTCGFIQPAKEESIEAILTLARLKNGRSGRKLVVTGCLAQRYASELAESMPELDGVFGLNDFTRIKDLIDGQQETLVVRHENPPKYPDPDFPRAIRTREPFAYLKISDGCDNRCSYCAIPDIRGHFRSRPMEAIVTEANYLLEQGKKELILVSQETTAYGRDIYGQVRIIGLLDELNKLGGEFWVRLMYLHPARLNAELIDYMIDNHRICSYFDLPLQHINDGILKVMGRKVTRAHIERLLDKIRSGRKKTAVRTNFIVGFPGETEAVFEELLEFAEARRFDRLGAFQYSPEDDTPAAGYAGQIEDEVKEERYHRLMEQQQRIAFENNDDEIGKHMEVIIDEIDNDGLAVGRSRYDAPEIDQNIRFESMGAGAGEIVSVVITGRDGYDLLGEREEV